MEFDDLLERVGSMGRYQKRLAYWVVGPSTCVMPFFILTLIFMLVIPDHWCHVPGRELTNLTVEQWKRYTLPREMGPDGHKRPSHCTMYNISYEDYDLLLSVNPGNTTYIPVTGCTHGWDYDATEFSRTASSENDWVCSDITKGTNSFTFFSIGNIIGSIIFGQLADRIGRRPVFFFTVLMSVVFRLVTLYTSQYYVVYLVCSTLAATSFPLVFQSLITIVAELCNKDFRAKLYGITCVAWVCGVCILPLVAWLSRDWVKLGLLTTVPTILLFGYIWVLPESPRWLISQGKYEKAAVILSKVAEVNGKKPPIDMMASLKVLGENTEKNYYVVRLFTSKRLALTTIHITICWTVNIMLFYIIQLNISNMAGNTFINFFLIGIIELPGNLLGIWFADHVGRRWTHTGFAFLETICCGLIITIVPVAELHWLVTVLCVIIKFSVSVTFLAVYLQAMELYPTCLRNTGIGFSSMIGCAINISGAYIVLLGTIDLRLPYAILGCCALIGTVSSSFIPETLNEALPDTAEDADNFGKGQSFWSWRRSFKKKKSRKENGYHVDPEECVKFPL